jgi:hypothetical protein
VLFRSSAILKAAILDSVELVPDFAGKTVTGGRLNARAALDQLDATYFDPPAPSNTHLPAVDGSAAHGGSVAGTPGTWDYEPTDFDYQWRRCDSSGGSCEDIAGATSAGYAPTADDVRHTLRVAVTATSPDGNATAVSLPTASVVGAPENTAPPIVGGVAKAGETLTASSGSWDFSPSSITYAWERCDSMLTTCTPLSAAQANYIVGDDDAGYRIRARVTATNAWGSSTSTVATATIAARPPAMSAPPVIVRLSGDAYLPGATVMTTTGTWAPEPTALTRRWQRCDATACVDVATGAIYEIVEADRGHDLRSVVSASNDAGTTEAASARIAIAGIDAPPPTDDSTPPTNDTPPPADDSTPPPPPPVVLPPPSPAKPPTSVLPPSPTPTPNRKATARVATPKLGRTTLSTTVTCTGTTGCRGTVAFAYKRRKLGTAKFDIAAKARKVISVKLSKATAKKLRRNAKVRVAIHLAAQP